MRTLSLLTILLIKVRMLPTGRVPAIDDAATECRFLLFFFYQNLFFSEYRLRLPCIVRSTHIRMS